MTEIAGVSPALEDTLPFGLSLARGRPLRGEDVFRKFLDELPAAIYATDVTGKITYFNAAAAVLWGRRPELGQSRWTGAVQLYRPDGSVLDLEDSPMALAIREKRPVRGIEVIAERPDGSRVSYLPHPTPLYDADGRLSGAVNIMLETGDRNLAATTAARLASIVESCDDAIISKDLGGTIQSWNHGAERLFGYSAAEALGNSIAIIIPPERLDEEKAILERLRRGERIDHYETIRRRKDGAVVEISLTVSPVKDHEGRIIGASKVARDIGERRRAQEMRTILLFEMKHRVKNTLATVQALANQTLKSASPEERNAFVGRLISLGAAHDLLTSEQWDHAPLRRVVDQALRAFQESHRERFLISGPDDIVLDSSKSLSLAMALHELATNAVKYGALSSPTGRVSVGWEKIPGEKPRIRLNWKERGGPAVAAPERKGFGSRLIEHSFGDGTRIDYDPRGLECVWEIGL